MAIKTKIEQLKVYSGNIKGYLKEINEILNGDIDFDALFTAEQKIDRLISEAENFKDITQKAYDDLEEE